MFALSFPNQISISLNFLMSKFILFDDAFFNRIGLERVGVAGPELELPLGRSAGSGRWTPLQKQETKGDRPGLARRRSDA